MRYFLGTRRKLTSTFRDEDGALADPTEVTVRVTKPNGTETVDVYNGGAGDVVRESIGVFSLDVDLDAEGWWTWRFEGSGALIAVDEGGISVWSGYQ